MKKALLMAMLCLVGFVARAASGAAASKGSPHLNVYFSKGFADGAWQKAAFERVAKSWSAATPPALGKKSVVIATIARDGKLLGTRLGTASGSKPWDDAAQAAVVKAAPFPPLPKSWTEPTTEVHWHFAFDK